MPLRSHHAEFGDFLRTRRQRLAPETVGLPVGPRRRSRGLRREEVALLANMSPTWYACLEQGRRVRPSVEVLDSLGDALRLNPTERRYLHALGAGPAQSVRPDIIPDPQATAVVRQLIEACSDLPYPTYAADGAGNLVSCNQHMSEWYADFAGCAGRDRNILWWLFTAPEARERIAGWEDDARDVVARSRFFVGTSRVDPVVDEMIRDLRAACAEFARWWDEHDVVEQESRHRTFRHPRLGIRTLQLVVVRPTVCPSVSIVFHLPANADTR